VGAEEKLFVPHSEEEEERLEWVIYFSWNPDQKKFERETIYSNRPLQP
jgi:hypothetical protein